MLRVANEKPIQNMDDYTLILADVGQMAINQLERGARELLQGTVSENAAIAIAEQLSSGRWTHDYPIIGDEAREIGLNVSNAMPKDIMDLMEMFPDTVRRTGSVRFIEEARALFAPRPNEVRMTGSQPDPTSRNYSYGPWNPQDLRQTFDVPRRGQGRD